MTSTVSLSTNHYNVHQISSQWGVELRPVQLGFATKGSCEYLETQSIPKDRYAKLIQLAASYQRLVSRHHSCPLICTGTGNCCFQFCIIW